MRALHLIEQPARRRDDDVDTLPQDLILPSITGAAKYYDSAQIGKAAIVAHGGFDLRGQLACRFEHQRAQLAALAQTREHRQRERGSFSGAGLSRADQIAARQDKGNRTQLNRCRIGVSGGFYAVEHFRGKSELTKRHSNL